MEVVIDILDNDAMEDLIIERMNSNKWFILPVFSEKATSFISAFENEFYNSRRHIGDYKI